MNGPAKQLLNLKCRTSRRWLQQVDNHLDQILIDHAHCENKAARTALMLMLRYVENEKLCRKMTDIINEKLQHFHLVCGILKKRNIRFRRLRGSNYGKQLNELIRRHEPEQAVDMLLIAALIEASSCERFEILYNHIEDDDLSRFYGSLFESEANHYATYVQLAHDFAPAMEVSQRLRQLATEEARIIEAGDKHPRMHS
ncbi:MAG: tRNA-(ms[2]io[6]A)-hydroxylase [Planctomycetota bacterium]|nr:tRNA-(ms[2]io[6]A)-hydroxylase [Planctomycetota bacterium]